ALPPAAGPLRPLPLLHRRRTRSARILVLCDVAAHPARAHRRRHQPRRRRAARTAPRLAPGRRDRFLTRTDRRRRRRGTRLGSHPVRGEAHLRPLALPPAWRTRRVHHPWTRVGGRGPRRAGTTPAPLGPIPPPRRSLGA